MKKENSSDVENSLGLQGDVENGLGLQGDQANQS